jgi:hypothetical protein
MISAHSTEDVSSFLLQQNSELESFYRTETLPTGSIRLQGFLTSYCTLIGLDKLAEFKLHNHQISQI